MTEVEKSCKWSNWIPNNSLNIFLSKILSYGSIRLYIYWILFGFLFCFFSPCVWFKNTQHNSPWCAAETGFMDKLNLISLEKFTKLFFRKGKIMLTSSLHRLSGPRRKCRCARHAVYGGFLSPLSHTKFHIKTVGSTGSSLEILRHLRAAQDRGLQL